MEDIWKAARLDPKKLEIHLEGTDDLEYRFKFVTALMQSADIKINHLDSLRQRSLVIALGIFAGLFSFALTTKSATQAGLTGGISTMIMLFFWIVDFRMSTYSHGWQATRWNFVNTLEKLVNTPTDNRDFLMYVIEAEDWSKFYRLKSLIHLLLVFGGVSTYFAWQLVQ